MKKLSEILHEETSDEFLAKMMASWEKAKAKLKSMGFEKAPIGPKTHQILIGKSKIEDLYGIPMRAGHWADVFFATMYDSKAPWCVIDREGRDCYANLDDAMKALQKRMRTIKEEAYTNYGDFAKQHKKMYPSHSEEQTKAAWEKYKSFHVKKEGVEDTELSDKTGETLAFLEDICEMADEIYETLSDYDEIDDATHALISQIYTSLDNAYESIDSKYDIQVSDDDYEVSESAVEEEAKSILEEIDMNRFKQLASTGLVSKDELPKLILAMRALDADKPLSMSQKDLINSTFQSLIAIVTGDTSVLSKVKSSIANN